MLIRTFLSWSLVLEIEERWPWQASQGRTKDSADLKKFKPFKSFKRFKVEDLKTVKSITSQDPTEFFSSL